MNLGPEIHFIFYMGPPVCPKSSDLFYLVTYYIKLVTTSWTYSSTPPQEHFVSNEKKQL